MHPQFFIIGAALQYTREILISFWFEFRLHGILTNAADRRCVFLRFVNINRSVVDIVLLTLCLVNTPTSKHNRLKLWNGYLKTILLWCNVSAHKGNTYHDRWIQNNQQQQIINNQQSKQKKGCHPVTCSWFTQSQATPQTTLRVHSFWNFTLHLTRDNTISNE